MTRCFCIGVLLMVCSWITAWGQGVTADTIVVPDTAVHLSKFQQIRQRIQERIDEKLNEPYDTVRDSGYWWRAMKHGKVDVTGKTIQYPKFLRFAWRVYKWGDKAFNSYDSAYVVGTGKNWKLILSSNNWMDSYTGEPFSDSQVVMRSNITSNIGLQLSFMAVSVGYTMGISDLIHGGNKSKKVDFSFTCARFAADAYYMENERPATLWFKDKAAGGKMKFRDFGGLHRKSYGMSIYYIFNNRRYAQAAAYCFSKYQRRSAGSFIAGVRMLHRDMSINVQELPEFAREFVPQDVELPRFVYNDYCVMVGYGYNFVLGKKWLLNFTLAPYTGYRKMIGTQHEDKASDWSVNLRARMGLVYNHRQFFFGLQSYADIHRYKSDLHNFYGSIIDSTAMAGIRF